MIRLFVEQDLAPDAAIPLRADQIHYLINVMRQGEGDEIRLFNGRDGEWSATLNELRKRAWAARPGDLAKPFVEGPDLDLLVAVVKRSRVETIVEKAAELGARRVRFLMTERTNASRLNLERLRAIAVEASEQTGRLDVPDLHEAVRLGDVLEAWDKDRGLMFCDEAGDASTVSTALLASKLDRQWAVLIGPEGGFSADERARIRALPQAEPVSLGPRILRADTAAIAALTLWQSVLGDWRPS